MWDACGCGGRAGRGGGWCCRGGFASGTTSFERTEEGSRFDSILINSFFTDVGRAREGGGGWGMGFSMRPEVTGREGKRRSRSGASSAGSPSKRT